MGILRCSHFGADITGSVGHLTIGMPLLDFQIQETIKRSYLLLTMSCTLMKASNWSREATYPLKIKKSIHQRQPSAQ